MGRINRLALRRRQPFTFWRTRQGRETPVVPVLSGGYWGIDATISPTNTPTDAVGWDKGTTDDTALLTTTDKAALDITGDMCLVACIRPDVIASGAQQRIFGKWGASGAFSYGLTISSVGRIEIVFSTTGSNISTEGSGATAPLTGVVNDGEKFWIAAAIDVNNGAAGRDKKYWWKRDGDAAWTQLGVTQTNTPNQTIFSGAGDLSIGRFPGDTTAQFNGTIYNVEVYNGIGAFTAPGQGTLVASANMRTPWASDTYSDGLGNTWTRTDGTWKVDPIYTVTSSTGLVGARFPHYVNDTVAMVPDSGDDSLSLWSYASGTSIVKKGTTGTQTTLDGARSAVIDATGAYAFVVSLESSRFSVYDVRQDTPQLVTSIQDTTQLGGARAIIRVGDYCYVTARDTARVTSVKVADPTNPVIVSSITHANLTDARGIVWNGANHVIVAANSVDRITSIDMSNPESLVYGGSLQDATNLDGIHEIAMYGNAAICACVNLPGRVTAIDMTSPTAPVFKSTLSLSVLTQSMYSIEIMGNYAYVSNLDLGWIVMIDVTNWLTSLSFVYATRPGTLTTGGGLYIDANKNLMPVVSYDEGTIALMKINPPAAPSGISIAQWAQVSDWFTQGGNGATKTITGLSWSAGDMIVVMGGSESQGATFAVTPSNANLTFGSPVTDSGGGGSECYGSMYVTTAASSQTGQTITLTHGATSLAAFGASVWVITGGPTGTANVTRNTTETAPSLLVTAGSIVLYSGFDWNATNPPGKTPLTGSGTATERRDQGNTTNWAQWIADWATVSGGTFSFGPNTYTSLQIQQLAIEILR